MSLLFENLYSIILITVYSSIFLMLLFTLLPTFGRLITHHEIRLVEGQNWVSFSLNLILFVSLVLQFFFTDFFKNILKPTLNFNKVYYLLLLVGSILLLIATRMLQGRKYSLFYWTKIYRNKEITDEDIFGSKKVLNHNQSILVNDNTDTLSTGTKTDNNISKEEDEKSDEENLDILVKSLSPSEVLGLIEKHKPYVMVNDINRKKIIDFASYKFVEFPIELNVTKYSEDTLSKKPVVKFLSELLLINNVWRKKDTQENIVNYVNSKFLIKSGSLEGKINRIDIDRYLFDK